MTKPNDGGPAFPQHDLSGYGMGPSMRGQTDEDYSGKYTVEGMSLHQWYAGIALQGLLTNPSMISPGQLKASRHHGNLVSLAKELADAMLAEEEPKP